MELELEKSEELGIELMRTDEDIELEILDIGNLELGGAGIKGEKGDAGQNGIGVPSGGLINEILVKSSNANYDTKWENVNNTQAILDLHETMAFEFQMFRQYDISPLMLDIEDIKQRLDNLENN